MQKRWFLILNVIFLLVIIGVLIYFVWEYSFDVEVEVGDECVDIHRLANYVYDSCYDNRTKKIFVEVKRGFDIYNLKGIRFNFFDYSDKTYEVNEVPDTNDAQSYQIYADKNPSNLNVFLTVLKDFSSPVCEEPRKVFVSDCPSYADENDLRVSLNPLNNNTPLEEFLDIGGFQDPDSDLLSPSLVDRERIWKSVCESKWECDPWEECRNGIERRECFDKNDCSVPTSLPETARYCDGTCVENWKCSWSECSGGYTVPDCTDLNNCGTNNNRPQRLDCETDSQCNPQVSCGAWSECAVDYNFLDLASGEINELTGQKTRICEDLNECTSPVEEVRDCSVTVDIYTRNFEKCGIEYIGIYNRLNNEIIARIEKSSGQADPYLNIHIDDGEDSEYCDYCFDGIQNGDETDVDCGGSCMACEVRHAKVNYRRMGAFARLADWIRNLFG